ncbi:Zn(2)-C6 fungal-type domain-containing protein [Mycena indigotica]|uniref:Zn(2)-C6 fungal-type domain-containing protein n=1 Tax=Mycena indigotica TaxID=2126181 RepID=A0A8H6W4Q2_9AGAR|nr:Zn(2)-C6 fungal-type domain-containing protein [Mycena indigotica]KAF7299169.1 Zn(2)-C6 fungal-type domain-containing protein [Mycena indigotica]
MSVEAEEVKVKVRRPDRSCDLCRRRKIRCDGSKKPNNTCSNCSFFGVDCTYLEPAKKRGPKSRVVEDLKRENLLLQAKLRALSVCSLCAQPLQKDPNGLLESSSASMFQQSNSDSPPSDEYEDEQNAEDSTGHELSTQFDKITIGSKYFGAVSNFALASSAIVVSTNPKSKTPITRVQAKERFTGQLSVTRRRTEIWDVLPWERDAYEQQTNYVYPDSDLISSLLFLYFENVHPTIPVLHQPSFERSVKENLYLRDPQFGGTLLVVLAIGSRYSDDPRVFVDGKSTLSSGWRFIKQLPVVRKWFEPTVDEIQFYFLMTFYYIGTSRPQGCWTYLGLGTRFLQQRGEHRYRRGHPPTYESELWNRVFWNFFCLDKSVCAFIGRPTGLHPEDVEADPPLEVDDKYWDANFVQPSGQPAYNAYMTYYVQLSDILGNATRRLYSSKKSKAMQGSDGRDWEQKVVADLDSTMNRCFDSFPDHLRWNPDSIDCVAFYDQAFVLYANYHYNRIVIHRPYIHGSNALAAPSLLICASAARAIIHASESWIKARRCLLPQMTISPIFVAIVLIIMSTFSSRAISAVVEKDKALVRSGLDLFKTCATRRRSEGRLWEMLHQLQSDESPFSRKDDVRDGQTHDPLNDGCFGPITALQSSMVNDALRLSSGSSLPNPNTPWTSVSASSHIPSSSASVSKPGLSIEQLLAETADLNALPPLDPDPSITNDDMMVDLSLWNDVPLDLSDISQWGAIFHKNSNWNLNF